MSIGNRLSFFKPGHLPRSSSPKGPSIARRPDDCRRRGRGGERNSRAREETQRLALEDLKGGDVLRVVTENTIYTFRILGPQEAELSTNRADRPEGPVQLRGCTFGRSSSICADFLLCGANLEFLFSVTRRIYKTSVIKAIYWVNQG